jgi:hypothetical protein
VDQKRNGRFQKLQDKPSSMLSRTLLFCAAAGFTALSSAHPVTPSPPASPPSLETSTYEPPSQPPPPPSPEVAAEDEPAPIPPPELLLDAPAIAKVRDGVVSWFEVQITHMDAFANISSDVMVERIVEAMQNTTEIVIEMANSTDGKVLKNIEVAMAQGKLVSWLNEAVGYMNSTSRVSASAVVSEMIDSIQPFTGISSDALKMVGGVPPPSRTRLRATFMRPSAEGVQLPLLPIVLAYCGGVLSAAGIAFGVTVSRRRALARKMAEAGVRGSLLMRDEY